MEGCGDPKCSNDCCISSASCRAELRGLDSNKAAAHAIQLVKSHARLCKSLSDQMPASTRPQHVHADNTQHSPLNGLSVSTVRTTPSSSAFQAEAVLSHTEPSLLQQPQQQQPNSTLAKQTPPADGERFSEADIRERIEFCREANQWAPLVHIVGQLFSDVGTLLRSFAIPSAVAKDDNGTSSNVTTVSPAAPSSIASGSGSAAASASSVNSMEMDGSSSPSPPPSAPSPTPTPVPVAAAAVSVSREDAALHALCRELGIGVDLPSVRRVYALLLAVPSEHYMCALVTAMGSLTRGIETDFKVCFVRVWALDCDQNETRAFETSVALAL